MSTPPGGDDPMDLELLFAPVEAVDAWLSGLLDGAPFAVCLLVAFGLGLRHASDPDHLVAVTSLVAAQGGDTRAAARLGGWWGIGHGGTLLALGLPLIVLESAVPAWLERAAEKAVGVVILLLAARVLLGWRRRGHGAGAPQRLRSPRQALGSGMLHGLAGTGAVVLLLVAALPGQLEAAAALAVFVPMSVVSMSVCTSAFAWALTRPGLQPVCGRVLVPALGAFGLLFGAWYVGAA
jgi:hypothetical protein